jgi:hypothetical protein
MVSFSSESDTAMPIDKDVLERLSKNTRAERIAWAVSVAQRYTDRAHAFGAYLRMLSEPGGYGYARLEDIRHDEAQLVEAVRTSARHANYALDELWREFDDGRSSMVKDILGENVAARVQRLSPDRIFTVPIKKPRARGF